MRLEEGNVTLVIGTTCWGYSYSSECEWVCVHRALALRWQPSNGAVIITDAAWGSLVMVRWGPYPENWWLGWSPDIQPSDIQEVGDQIQELGAPSHISAKFPVPDREVVANLMEVGRQVLRENLEDREVVI